MARVFYPGVMRYNGKKSFEGALSRGTITEDDRTLITEYLNERQAQRELSAGRINKIIFTLVNWRRFLQAPYRDAQISDIFQAVTGLKHGRSCKGEPFKQNTIHDYIRILKPFLLWLIENQYSSLPEKKIRQITAPSVDHQTTSPDEILTVDEIETLIRACLNTRDRALIATLYESGARIGELCRLRWRDAVFDEYGVKLYITDTKTAKNRYSRLISSREYLAAWKADYHPVEPIPDALIFQTFTGLPFDWIQATRVISRAVARSGIQKRVHPHLFRKSRITHMIAQNYQESVIKESMWGNLGTDMFQSYVQLAEKDIDAEFLARAGVVPKEESTPAFLPRPCPECGNLAAPTADYCARCGAALTDEARAKQEQRLSQVIETVESDPRYAFIDRKLDEFRKGLLRDMGL